MRYITCILFHGVSIYNASKPCVLYNEYHLQKNQIAWIRFTSVSSKAVPLRTCVIKSSNSEKTILRRSNVLQLQSYLHMTFEKPVIKQGSVQCENVVEYRAGISFTLNFCAFLHVLDSSNFISSNGGQDAGQLSVLVAGTFFLSCLIVVDSLDKHMFCLGCRIL